MVVGVNIHVYYKYFLHCLARDNLGPATPSGGIITNSVDMQKWLLFLTAKGLAEDGSRVMNESDIMRTMREQSLPYYVNVPEDPEQPLDYAPSGISLGWYNALYRGTLN